MAAAAITLDRDALPDAAAVRALLQVTQCTHPVHIAPRPGAEARQSVHIASPTNTAPTTQPAKCICNLELEGCNWQCSGKRR